MVIILVYVDDLLIIGSCQTMIQATKKILHLCFKVKDLGKLKYFLGIEILRSQKDILLNQRKYALSLVSEVVLSWEKHASSPLEQN